MMVFSRKISDPEIIEGILLHDDRVLKWLYDNYFQSVRTLVTQNSGSDEDAADVFQDSLIIIYRQITEKNLNLTSDLKGYFYGIARNVWRSHLRKKQKHTPFELDIHENEDIDETADLQLEKIVSRAFMKLKPDQQLILQLFSQGLTYPEIALRMNLKNETYARRKKYLSKEALLEIIKKDREYQEFFLRRR